MLRALLFSLIFMILTLHGQGQEIYFYGVNNKPLESKKEAVIIKTLHRKSETKYLINTQTRLNNQWIEIERQKIRAQQDGKLRIRIKGERIFPKTIYREITSSEPGLYYFEETAKGIKKRTGTSGSYLPLLLESKVTEYHPNGMEKSVSLFQNNQLISNQNWLSDGTSYIDSIFYSADQEPVYQPGGDNFRSYILQQIGKSEINLDEYNDEIVIGWVVMETGIIDGVIALKGKSLVLNKILVDIVARVPGEWKPAILDGKHVRYFMSIPLNISHNNAKFQDVELSKGVLHYNIY